MWRIRFLWWSAHHCHGDGFVLEKNSLIRCSECGLYFKE